MHHRNQTSFGKIIIIMFLAATFSAAIGRDDLHGCGIEFSNQFPFGMGLLFFPVPIKSGFLNISNTAAFIKFLQAPCFIPLIVNDIINFTLK